MLHHVAEVSRLFDAAPVNEICNHPDVRPSLGGDGASQIDVQPLLDNPNNIALHRDGFAALFVAVIPGVYEVHTQASPDARARHSVFASAIAMLHWMFTRTAAYEIVTRCPDDNVPARKLIDAMGFDLHFRLDRGWSDGKVMRPCNVFALGLNAWVASAPGLEVLGEEYHAALHAAEAAAGVEREQHPSDPVHDRWSGVAFEMARHGQLVKAAVTYNRWALLSGYQPITVISHTPPVVHIGDAAVELVPDGSLRLVKGV